MHYHDTDMSYHVISQPTLFLISGLRALRVEGAAVRNISFEEMTPSQAVQRMSTVHVFVSVHGKALDVMSDIDR